MDPQIASARRKLAWADVRLDELKSAVAELVQHELVKMTVDGDFDEKVAKIHKAARETVFPNDSPIPLIAGDVVGNLNAALDHAHKAIFDESERDSSKFPGFPVPARNQVHSTDWRKHIFNSVSASRKWVAALQIIESLYENVTKETWADHPACRLRGIVNADKHALTMGLRAATGGFVLRAQPEGIASFTAVDGSGLFDTIKFMASGDIEPPDNDPESPIPSLARRFVSTDSIEIHARVQVVRQMHSGIELTHEMKQIQRFVTKAVDSYEEAFDTETSPSA